MSVVDWVVKKLTYSLRDLTYSAAVDGCELVQSAKISAGSDGQELQLTFSEMVRDGNGAAYISLTHDGSVFYRKNLHAGETTHTIQFTNYELSKLNYGVVILDGDLNVIDSGDVSITEMKM